MKAELIEIKQDMPGFNGFLGSWVLQADRVCIVDVGPANTSGRLLASLESLGLDQVDYILLTHIHIDHAGALADILDHYPMAKVVCHEKAIKFLVDPSKLWAGSLSVLGKIAEGYGRPKPVLTERLIPHRQCSVKGLKAIETPGHAVHHLSFIFQDILFAGEAGGNYFLVQDTEYLRPATPPRFFFEVFLNSLESLIKLNTNSICYAHFGIGKDPTRLLKKFRHQLFRWKEIIYKQMQEKQDDLMNRCIEALIEKDPDLAAFHKMDPDSQKRERIFLANSINGFMGYFSESSG